MKTKTENFNEAHGRIKEVTGCRTQVELAAFLGIRQSSISDAKRRGSVPPDWMLTLVRKTGTNPAWIETGKGPRYLVASTQPGEIVPGEYVRPIVQVAPSTVAEHKAAIEELLPGFQVVIADPFVRGLLAKFVAVAGKTEVTVNKLDEFPGLTMEIPDQAAA